MKFKWKCLREMQNRQKRDGTMQTIWKERNLTMDNGMLRFIDFAGPAASFAEGMGGIPVGKNGLATGKKMYLILVESIPILT